MSTRPAPSDWPIIRRLGDQLLEGERPFRFLGLAVPNIHQNECQLHPDYSNRFPDEFEIRDTLDGLRRLGSRATRSFSLSVFHPDDRGLPVYITARRTFNEEALCCLDRILALCPEYDQRLILPIIASQSFVGWRGVEEYALLAGKPGPSFWTDPELKEDYKFLFHTLANRRNTVSGLLYKDDPAILAWQFGNEFFSYALDRKFDQAVWSPIITAWTLEMAAFIKQTDPKHLLIEANGGDRDAFIADPHIDILSDHLYEHWHRVFGFPTDLAMLARETMHRARGKKAVIIDEFGLCTWDNLCALLRTIREEGLTGGLLWSLRGHRRDGGFYCHNEGGTPVNSYHVPGFAVGSSYDETRTLDLMRAEAYAIRGLPVPPVEAPSPAPVLARTRGTGLTWRGSSGASHYTLQHAASAEGPWTTVADGIQDSITHDVAAYEASGDSEPQAFWYEALPPADTRFYRVRGVNAAGPGAWSEVLRIPSDPSQF